MAPASTGCSDLPANDPKSIWIFQGIPVRQEKCASFTTYLLSAMSNRKYWRATISGRNAERICESLTVLGKTKVRQERFALHAELIKCFSSSSKSRDWK